MNDRCGSHSEAAVDETSPSVPLLWRGYWKSDVAIHLHDLDLGLQALMGRCRLEYPMSTDMLRT